MNHAPSQYERISPSLNRRRPMFKESTKYAFASGVAIGTLAGVLVTFTVALFR